MARCPVFCSVLLTVSALVALLGPSGCMQHKGEPQAIPSASEPSPNASVLPAPLAAGPTKAPARDAGKPPGEPSSDVAVPEPPRVIREDDDLAVDAELRSAPGAAFDARFRWLEPSPPRAPEGNADALKRGADKSGFDVHVELSSLGRLRVVLSTKAFPFTGGSELRARDDRYGHVLVWPHQEVYTPLPPGTLRAALAETRVDAGTLSDPQVSLTGTGNLLGFPTQKQRLETGLGRLELEQTSATGVVAGALFCRLLVELLAVAPESAACRPDWLPLRAEYTWASGNRFELEVTKFGKRPELAPEGFAVPPLGAVARQGELPSLPFVALLDEHELSELHTRALPPPAKPEAGAPKLGLVLQNHGDAPRYFLIDGVPTVWLRPEGEWLASGLKSGRYAVQARDFFGSESTPWRSLELPARFVVGDEAERAQR